MNKHNLIEIIRFIYQKCLLEFQCLSKNDHHAIVQ
jgi:hypothetical protein